ncbi:Ig-like domain-containing protein [Aquibacillus kalidii]|uniref:Ig-like domain-containing protein n=1 Tax=Aquibacillus kalidii TaxID=2762597 RepID=UPI001647BF35|nr:Ig-like domain-containing protein [Aquibacillus kalidii]
MESRTITHQQKKRKKLYWLPFVAVFLVSALLFSTHVFSSSDLNMIITYQQDDGTKANWDLSESGKPDGQWKTTKDQFTFEVDLSEYFEKEVTKDRPFDVKASYQTHTNDLVTKVTEVQETDGETTSFQGKYTITVIDEDGTLEDGEISTKLEILTTEGWDIPTEKSPIVISVIKDTTAPVVTLSGISEGELFHKEGSIKRYPELKVTVNEKNFDESNVTIEGAELVGNGWNDDGGDSYTKTYKIEQDGVYNLKVKATDVYGNTSEEQQVSFLVHNEEPEFIVQSDGQTITDGTMFNGAKTVDLQVVNGIPLKEANLTVQKDGESYKNVGDFSINANKATLSQLFSEPGAYKLIMTAKDATGENIHTMAEPLTFTIDTTKPVVTITDENDNSIEDKINNHNKTVNVTINERHFNDKKVDINVFKKENDSYVQINKSFSDWKVTSENTHTSSTVFNDDGHYKVVVDASDIPGNSAEVQTVLFTVDKSSPLIEIAGVKNGEHYNVDKQANIQVIDFLFNRDDTNLKVSHRNQETDEEKQLDIALDFTKIPASAKPTFTEEGQYQIDLESIDFAGNKTEDHVRFIIDKTAPKLSMSELSGLYLNKEQEVAVSVTETNYQDNKVSFTVTKDGKDITEQVEEEAGSNWTNVGKLAELNYKFGQDGYYTIHLSAEDKAGNKSELEQKQFHIDQTNPQISIDGVEDGTHYDETKSVTIQIKDRNFNSNTVTVTRNGKPYEIEGLKVEDSEFGNSTARLGHDFEQEGDYKIVVRSLDKAGNSTNQQVSFTVDKTKPDLKLTNTIDSHISAETIADLGLNSLIKVSLKELNVATKSVSVKHIGLDGKEATLTESEIGQWSKQEGKNDSYDFIFKNKVFNKDGVYTIDVVAKDKAGVESKETTSFTVDNIKPEITLSNMDLYYDKAQTVTVKVEEFNAKKNTVTIDVFRENNNGEFVHYDSDKFKDWNQKDATKTTKLNFPFNEDGKYKIVVNAVDDAGNKAVEKSEVFTIDTVAPVLSIKGIEVTDSINHYNSSKYVEISVNDTNINEDTTTLLIKKLNRATGKMENYQTSKFAFTKTTATFAHNFSTDKEGTYSIELSATDKSGNKPESKKVTFVIDDTAPILAIDNIENGSYNSSSKKVSMSVKETNYETNSVNFLVTKDGQEITNQVEQGKDWKYTNELSKLSYNFTSDGFYTIKLSAKDAAGNNSTSKQKQFTIDKTKPVIELTGVDGNAFYNEDKRLSVTIRDRNFKTNTINVTRNGRSYNVGGFSVTNKKYADSVASLSHNFSQEGEYKVVVEATDQAGNSFSQQITFTIDKTKPVITPNIKGDGTVIKDGAYINKVFTPQFSLDKPREDKIVSVILNNGSNIAGKVPVASKEMVYNYKVLARDKAGNESTLELSFTLDTTKPELNINGVIEGFFNNNINPRVTYSDIHLDRNKTFVTLNGQPFVNGTRLEKERDYVLKAVITDLANNVSARTIVFTIDKTSPVIKFKEDISDKYLNENIIPELLINDLNEYDIISQTLDGVPYQIGDPIEGEGKHVLFFEVKDKAGNIQQLSVEFIIDKTPPEIIFDGIEKNGEYFDPVKLKIRLDNPQDKIKSIMINGEVFDGKVVEEDGYQVIEASLSDINKYEIKVEAYDEAGNVTESIIPFEIAEKSAVTKFYENKVLFASTIAGLCLVVLGGGGTLVYRRRKAKVISEEEILEKAE